MVLSIDRLHNSTTLEEIMMDSHEWNKPLYRRAAESWNHDFYFKCMTMNYVPPSDQLLEQIERDFGSFSQFRIDFRKAGNSLFGSGWAWVVYNVWAESLEIRTTTGGDNPITIFEYLQPILAMDMWEHAYISDFKSKRDYTKTFVSALVDWKFVEETLAKVKNEAARTREEMERRQLEAEAKAVARKAEISRLTAQVAADAKQLELASIEVENFIDEGEQGDSVLENQVVATTEGSDVLEGKLQMLESGRGVDRFPTDAQSQISESMSFLHGTSNNQFEIEHVEEIVVLDRDIGSADSGGHLLSDDQQSIVGETVCGTSRDSYSPIAGGHDATCAMTLLEDRKIFLGDSNEVLDNTIVLVPVEAPKLEAVVGIKRQERVGLLSLFFRGAKNGDGSLSGNKQAKRTTTMGSGIMGYLWNLLGSRKTKETASHADSAANESSAVTEMIPTSTANETDDSDESIVALNLPEEVVTVTTPVITESHEEKNEKISGPTNPHSKTLSFIWNIICSLFRFLRFIWSLG
jgi:superoxide dismutase